jgi:hypothetical protein
VVVLDDFGDADPLRIACVITDPGRKSTVVRDGSSELADLRVPYVNELLSGNLTDPPSPGSVPAGNRPDLTRRPVARHT